MDLNEIIRELNVQKETYEKLGNEINNDTTKAFVYKSKALLYEQAIRLLNIVKLDAPHLIPEE